MSWNQSSTLRRFLGILVILDGYVFSILKPIEIIESLTQRHLCQSESISRFLWYDLRDTFTSDEFLVSKEGVPRRGFLVGRPGF